MGQGSYSENVSVSTYVVVSGTSSRKTVVLYCVTVLDSYSVTWVSMVSVFDCALT